MTDLINRAFLFALQAHKGQKRKDGKEYIAHPFAVAMRLAKNGADDTLIAAGLLHDTIEDAGVSAETLKKEFGEEVLRLVLFDTDDKTLSWEERKTANIKALNNCDRACAMLMCADKLENLNDIQTGLETTGESVWLNFKYGREKQEQLYRAYVAYLAQLSDSKMYNELKATVNHIFKQEKRL